MFAKWKKNVVGCAFFALIACGLSLSAAEGRKLSGVDDPDDALNRLFDRETHMIFRMVGRGSSSKWTIKGVANFQYNVLVEARSHILKKERLPRGRYRVVELHKFVKMSDMLGVSKADITIDTSDFNKQKFEELYKNLRALITVLSGPVPILAMDKAKSVAEAALNEVDGVSLKKVLDAIGLPGDAIIEDFVKGIFRQGFNAKIRPLEGKTYRVTYILGKNKLPISMSYTYEDGTSVTNDEEKAVLKRLNAFIDTHTVPNRKCRVGDEWPVHSGDIEQIMDPYVDSSFKGDITVKRVENDSDGTWNLIMKPADLAIVDDAGIATGSIKLKKGDGHVDPKNCTIEDIHVEGLAKMNRVSRNHWLFRSRISGWSAFVGKLTSIRLK